MRLLWLPCGCQQLEFLPQKKGSAAHLKTVVPVGDMHLHQRRQLGLHRNHCRCYNIMHLQGAHVNAFRSHVQAGVLPSKLTFSKVMTGPRHRCWRLLLQQPLYNNCKTFQAPAFCLKAS